MNKNNNPSNKYDLYMKIDKKQKQLEKKVAIRYLIERIKKVIKYEQ